MKDNLVLHLCTQCDFAKKCTEEEYREHLKTHIPEVEEENNG